MIALTSKWSFMTVILISGKRQRVDADIRHLSTPCWQCVVLLLHFQHRESIVDCSGTFCFHEELRTKLRNTLISILVERSLSEYTCAMVLTGWDMNHSLIVNMPSGHCITCEWHWLLKMTFYSFILIIILIQLVAVVWGLSHRQRKHPKSGRAKLPPFPFPSTHLFPSPFSFSFFPLPFPFVPSSSLRSTPLKCS